MKYIFHKVSYLFVLGFISVPGFLALAQTGSRTPTPAPLPRLKNPLEGVNSFADLVAAVLKLVVQIGVPVAVVFLMYSGYMFVSARGDTKKIETARTSLLYTSIGIAILLGAQLIAGAIGSTIQQLQ